MEHKGKDQVFEERKGKLKWLIPVISVVIILILVGVSVMALNSPSRRLKKQLDLGQKYLNELEYEKAIAAFTAAIEIEPKCEEAYKGMADAYVGLGEYEKAIAILERGYEITGSAALMDYISTIEAMIGTAVLPQWEGKKREEFLRELDALGLKYETVTESSYVLPDYVLSCDLHAGQEIKRQETVHVTISTGLDYDPASKHKVEDLRGKTLAEARDVLASNGIYLVEGPGVYDDVIQLGLIATQDIAPDEVINAGSIVTVGLSLGIEMIEVPSLVGKAKEAAVKELEAVGFNTVILEVKKTDAEDGIVLEQDVAAGEKLPKNSDVTLTIARKGYVVPILSGKTSEEAVSLCEQNGFTYRIEEVLGEEGKVIGQSPNANEVFEEPVKIVIQVGISDKTFKKKLFEAINAKRKKVNSNAYVLDDVWCASAEEMLQSKLGEKEFTGSWHRGGQWDGVPDEYKDRFVECGALWMNRKNVTTVNDLINRLDSYTFQEGSFDNSIGIAIKDDRVCVIVGFTSKGGTLEDYQSGANRVQLVKLPLITEQDITRYN